MTQGNGVSKLRPSRVSAEFGIAEQTLANWRSTGRGPVFSRLSPRMIAYDRADVEQFFSDRKVTPGRAAG
jgi:predicted DNA-binding transcriptional regulator AlpA